MSFFITNRFIPRSKIKRMDFFFNSVIEKPTGQKRVVDRIIKSGIHYMNYTVIDNVPPSRPLNPMWTPSGYNFVMNGKDITYRVSITLDDIKKERIKQLKIKEPVKYTYWVDDVDIIHYKKERMKELKLKEPVKKSNFVDDDLYL